MKYTLSVLVENQAGVLSKISGLFSRRGFNIDSLAVGIAETPNLSRITIVVNGDEYLIEQLEKQLNKLISVVKVKVLDNNTISRELALIKVNANSKTRFEIIKIAEVTKSNIANISANTITIECSNTTDHIETLIMLLKPYGIKQIARTGTVALENGDSSAK